MNNKVKSVIKKYNMIPKGASVVAAVSGGSDSMALLAVLNSVKDEYGITLCAAHVNHCLRGADADRDEEFVVQKCNEMGVPVHVLKTDVAKEAEKSGESFEECGRRIRYGFFNSLGDNIIIATAHNLSDRVETFLFNFARGSALRGLGSIPVKRDNIIRPLIECTKAEILDFCEKNSIEYVTDVTNADVKYARNRIRHNVITELCKINPSFEKNAGRCISSVNEDEAFLSSLAESLVKNSERKNGFDALILAEAPIPVKKRAIIKICEECVGITPEQKFVAQICDLIEKSGNIQINGGVTVRVRKGMLDFPSDGGAAYNAETVEGKTCFGEARIETEIVHVNEINNLQNISKQVLEYFLDCDKIHGRMVVRSREAGDRISLRTRGCSKTLKKLFNELSVPPEKRNEIAVFADEAGIVLVEGIGCDSRTAITKETKKVLKIKIFRDDKNMGCERKSGNAE